MNRGGREGGCSFNSFSCHLNNWRFISHFKGSGTVSKFEQNPFKSCREWLNPLGLVSCLSLLKDEQKVLTRVKEPSRKKTPLVQNNHMWDDRFLATGAKKQQLGVQHDHQWFCESAGGILEVFGCREVGRSSSCTVSGPSNARRWKPESEQAFKNGQLQSESSHGPGQNNGVCWAEQPTHTRLSTRDLKRGHGWCCLTWFLCYLKVSGLSISW